MGMLTRIKAKIEAAETLVEQKLEALIAEVDAEIVGIKAHLVEEKAAATSGEAATATSTEEPVNTTQVETPAA